MLKRIYNKIYKVLKLVDKSTKLILCYWGNDKSLFEKFKQDNSNIWEEKCSEISEYVIGAIIGVHVGPGAIGMAFFKK